MQKNGKPSSDHLSCQALLVSELELQFPVLLPPLVQLPLIEERDKRKKLRICERLRLDYLHAVDVLL